MVGFEEGECLVVWIFGAFLPVLFQSLITWLVIEANTGNGSFVGLAAFLLAMFAIPLTLIVNTIYVLKRKSASALHMIWRCWLMALTAPFVTLLLLIVG